LWEIHKSGSVRGIENPKGNYTMSARQWCFLSLITIFLGCTINPRGKEYKIAGQLYYTSMDDSVCAQVSRQGWTDIPCAIPYADKKLRLYSAPNNSLPVCEYSIIQTDGHGKFNAVTRNPTNYVEINDSTLVECIDSVSTRCLDIYVDFEKLTAESVFVVDTFVTCGKMEW
jgi:hypothetical protein